MRAIAVAFACLLMLPTSGFGQTAAQRFAAVRESYHRNEHLKALGELKTFEAQYPDSFQVNELDYLSARLSQRTGNTGQAASYFQKVRARNSILREYATWHLAAIARDGGNLLGERVLLLELLADRPDSLMADAARQRIAQSHFESKDFDAVIASLESLPGTGQRPRDLELLYAKALLFKNEKDAARQMFNGVISSTSNPAQPDDLVLEAVKALDLIEVGSEQFGKTTAKLSEYEHLKRAAIYQFNRDFVDARLHFLAIVNDHPTSGIVPDALYQIGRGYTQLREFTEAVKWFERVSEQYPEHPANKEATLQLGSAYARVGRYREAIARYDRYIRDYPDDEKLDRAYLNIIDVLRDAGEITEAIGRADRAAEVFKGKPAEAQAIFAKARIRIAQTEWASALLELDSLLILKDLSGAGIPGGTIRSEVAFLRGLVLEELHRYPEAISAYLSIPDGRNEYYGGLATVRLKNLSSNPDSKTAVSNILHGLISAYPVTADERRKSISGALRIVADEGQRTKLLDDLRKTYAELPAYKISALPKAAEIGRKDLRSGFQPEARTSKAISGELAFLGLFDEAAPEYEASIRGATISDKKLTTEQEYTIASMYLNGDRADRAASFIEPMLRSLPADFHIELLPREITPMLYPIPYRDALLSHAASRGVDPRFLLSIMRQESMFRPNVKSVAAARGLMQFITDTSIKIAGELGRDRFDQNELYHPPTAVLFGSQYVSNLFELFPNQPDAVAASYNGGEDNMKRWLGRSRSDDPGRYVPEIAFAQSKDYVWRVISNYRMYQLLYDQRLNAR